MSSTPRVDEDLNFNQQFFDDSESLRNDLIASLTRDINNIGNPITSQDVT